MTLPRVSDSLRQAKGALCRQGRPQSAGIAEHRRYPSKASTLRSGLEVGKGAFRCVIRKLSPARRFTLEEALEFIADDELVEITPDDIRLRKKLLHELERRRAGRREEH